MKRLAIALALLVGSAGAAADGGPRYALVIDGVEVDAQPVFRFTRTHPSVSGDLGPDGVDGRCEGRPYIYPDRVEVYLVCYLPNREIRSTPRGESASLSVAGHDVWLGRKDR